MLQNMQVAHESDIRDNGSYAIGDQRGSWARDVPNSLSCSSEGL
jgi:hypothetical protein